MSRVTADALRLAAEWLDEYENDDDDLADKVALTAVAEFLRVEATRRERDAAIRTLARAAATDVGRKPNDPALLAAARRIVMANVR